MSFIDGIKGLFNAQEDSESELASEHRLQVSVLEQFHQKIGKRSFEELTGEFNSVSQPGEFHLTGNGGLDHYDSKGFIETREIAGKEFYTFTERGRITVENSREISEELEILSEISDHDTEIVDDLADLEEKIPPEYDMGRTQHESGLKEKQHVAENGMAAWRITEEGIDLKDKIEELDPRQTARITVLPESYRPGPEEIMRTIKDYSSRLDGAEMSEEIIDSLERAVESEDISSTIESFSIYKDLLTDADIEQVGEKSSYVADIRNQIEGIRSIYRSVIEENGCLSISEDIAIEEVEEMLRSDAMEIYSRISEVHKQVYS